MANVTIFLSHIHEEQELAILIKKTVEAEFSGFVDVFVSSDGVSIPSGTDFLRRIESGLMDCVAAIYLISPKSIGRNWINFELGAVWLRNAINLRDNKPEIPTIPFCHSGCKPSNLPVPLNTLSAIEAYQTHQLSSAFDSMQRAVGGSGPLKTNFDELARGVASFEKKYTVSNNLLALLELLDLNPSAVTRDSSQNPHAQLVTVQGIVESHAIGEMRRILGESSEFVLFHEIGQSSIVVHGDNGLCRRSGVEYSVSFDRNLLRPV